MSKIESSASEKPSWTSRKLENEAFRPSILCSKMPKLKFARRWTSRNIFDASKLGKSTRCLPLCSKIAQSRKRCFWSKTKIDGRIQTMDALLTYRFFLGLILEHVVPYNNWTEADSYFLFLYAPYLIPRVALGAVIFWPTQVGPKRTPRVRGTQKWTPVMKMPVEVARTTGRLVGASLRNPGTRKRDRNRTKIAPILGLCL